MKLPFSDRDIIGARNSKYTPKFLKKKKFIWTMIFRQEKDFPTSLPEPKIYDG